MLVGFVDARCGVVLEHVRRRAAATSAPTTRPVTTTTVKRNQPVVLAFGGDVHFEGVLRSLLAANPSTVLAPIAPVLESADLAMVNLETAITERGTPQPKQYTFRAPASAFTALAAGGVDVTTMANNHGMDFGEVGFNDSLNADSRRRASRSSASAPTPPTRTRRTGARCTASASRSSAPPRSSTTC